MRQIDRKRAVAESFSGPAPHPHRKMKQELVSRLYGQGVPYFPLPAVKRSFDVQDPSQRPLTAKMGNTRKMKELNMTVEGSGAFRAEDSATRAYLPAAELNLSEVHLDRPPQQRYLRGSKAAREALYSTNRPSIAGVNVMSALKPRLNASFDRSSAYSMKSGTAQGGPRRKVLHGVEETKAEHKASTSCIVNAARVPLSPQEQLENVCSRKLVDKMRSQVATSQGRRPTAPAALAQRPPEDITAMFRAGISRKGTAGPEHFPRMDENRMGAELPLREFMAEDTAMDQFPAEEKGEGKKEEKKEPIPWADMDKYIEALLEDKPAATAKFMYFNLKECKENAYDLDITDYANRNVARHYTISKKGVTQYDHDEATEFVPLREWLIERELYNNVKGISFFCNFHRWKMINSWRKRIWAARKKQITDDLEEKLFYLDPIYREHLLQHKGYMCEMARLRLVDVQKQSDTGNIDEFSQRQKKKRKEAGTKVREYSAKCRENIRTLIKRSLDKLRNRILLEKSLNDDRGATKTSSADPNGNNKPVTANPVFENLGFPENMTYGHRSALRRECSRFLRLAYLVDFISVKSLNDIYVETVRDTLRVLSHLDLNAQMEINAAQNILRKAAAQEPILLVSIAFNPQSEIPKDKIVAKQIKPFSDKISKPKEFDLDCHVEVAAEKDDESTTVAFMLKKYVRKEVPGIIDYWLRLVPTKEEFFELMMRCMSEGLKMLELFERWSRHDELLPYAGVLEEWDEIVGGDWDVSETNCLAPREQIYKTADYERQEADFRQVIFSAYGKCYDFLQKFAKFLNIYWRDVNADLSLIVHERVVKPAETLANALRLLEYQKKMFLEKIPETCNIGLIKIDCAPVRKALLPAPADAIHKIEVLVSEALRSRLETIKAWMADSRAQLEIKVDTVADYVKQRIAWNEIADNYQETKDKVDTYGELYAILSEFNVPVKKDDKQFHTGALQEIVQMNQILSNVSDHQELNLEKFKRKLQDQLIPQLQSDLDQLKKDIDDEVLLTRQEDIVKIIAKIDSLESRFKTHEGLSTRYNEYQEKLNIEPTVFESLPLIKEGLNLRAELWRSLKDWGMLTQAWIAHPFATINAREIGEKADEYAKIAARVDKELPENPVSKELKAVVDTFRKAMPIVSALRNEALRKQHWKAIKQLLQAEFETTDHSFTLRSLLDLKAINFQEEIQQISVQASQEALLGSQLLDLDEKWKKCIFVTKQHKMKETYVLDKTEELFNLLDESLVSINAILGDKYIKPLLVQAENWRQTLINLQAIMDEWVTCQKQWIYLENIGPEVRRELGNEANKFEAVDKFFKGLMQKAIKTGQPIKLLKTYKGDLLDHLRHNNKTMEEIKRLFQDYLDAKRRSFPRFYFLSAEELLELLANQQQLEVVQRNLSKLFTSLSQLDVREGVEITAFMSAEGERVPFGKSIRLKEDMVGWLEQVQTSARETIQRLMKAAITDHDELERKDWAIKYPVQVVHAVTHVIWCAATESAISELSGNSNSLIEWYEENVGQIQQLSELSRADRPDKAKFKVLLTIALHSRDVIEELVLASTDHISDYNWLKELRFYWEDEEVVQSQQSPVYLSVRQMNSKLEYGGEYIGPSARLILTPSTSRAWVGITSALTSQLCVAMIGGESSAKVETVQELGRTIGKYCVAVNCLGLTGCKAISRALSGAAQEGAWVCLGGINRVSVEVLSVMAKQLGELRTALIRGSASIMMDEKELAIRGDFGIFASMTGLMSVLPENMKCHLRPVFVGMPELEQLAEATLLIAGFSQNKMLAKKICGLCRSLKNLLSPQGYYDFSLRTVLGIIRVAAEGVGRKSDEVAACIAAAKVLLEPKLVPEDLPVFQGVLIDFFPPQSQSPAHSTSLSLSLPAPPAIEKPKPTAEETLSDTISRLLEKRGMPKSAAVQSKCVQLNQLLTANPGVIILGQTGSGKSTLCDLLKDARTELAAGSRKFSLESVNPKALSVGELFGGTSPLTQEWIEGLIPKMVRHVLPETDLWLKFDGTIDPTWTQALSKTLEPSKRMLCLPAGETVRLGDEIHFLFETDEVRASDPGTISRCGILHVPLETISWQGLTEAWANRIYPDDPELRGHIYFMFEQTIERGVNKVRASGTELVRTTDLQLVENVCHIIESVLPSANCIGDKNDKKKVAGLVYCFAFIWGIGGSIDESSREKLDLLIRSLFDSVEIPPAQSVFEFYLDPKKGMAFRPWAEVVPSFVLPSLDTAGLQQIVVPTVETVRQAYFTEQFLARNKGIFFVGGSSVGKSLLIKSSLETLKISKGIVPVILSFSSATTSLKTQLAIEEKLQKKRRDTYGAQVGKKIAVFVDDAYLPAKDCSGTRPAIEFLRQLIERRGTYDREKLFWKGIEDCTVLCAGRGGNDISPRFARKFNIISVPQPNRAVIEQIFTSILGDVLKVRGFPEGVQALAHDIAVTSIEIFSAISAQLRPVPAKFFYAFSFRDISKMIQGIAMASAQSVNNVEAFARLWTHELCRVFQDRLEGTEDKAWVANLVFEQVTKTAKVSWDYCEVFELHKIYWSRAFNSNPIPLYEEIKDITATRTLLDLEMANMFSTDPHLPSLALFEDAVETLLRITRVLSQPRGYLLLLGASGVGKTSLTRFATFISKCELREVAKPSLDSFVDLLKEIVQSAGISGKMTCLLLTQRQISNEDIMDLVNSLMCCGEIPRLFSAEEMDKIISEMRPIVAVLKRDESRGSMYATFLERVHQNLKIVFSARPAGDFAEICHKFPSLLGATTIVHVPCWGPSVLLGLSKKSMGELEDCPSGVRRSLAEAALGIHQNMQGEIGYENNVGQSQYVEFLKLFVGLVKKKKSEFTSAGEKVISALERLKEARSRIEEVNVKVDQLQAQLKEKTDSAELSQKKVSEQQKLMFEFEKAVFTHNHDVGEKTKQVKLLNDEAEAEVNASRPEMTTILNELKQIDKKVWQDIQTTSSPHPTSVLILEAVMVLLQEKTDWNGVRTVMDDNAAFLSRLVAYSEKSVPTAESVMKKLRTNYLNLPELDPDQIKGKATSFKPVARWVKFIAAYQDVLTRAEPKRRRYETEKDKLEHASTVLAGKSKLLAETRTRIGQLKAECENLQEEKNRIAEEISATKRRAVHSEELTLLLGDEGERWKKEEAEIKNLNAKLMGNLLTSAACIVYTGLLGDGARKLMVQKWIECAAQQNIQVSEPFDLSRIMVNNRGVLEDWTNNELPKDKRAEENAILAVNCWKWPLLLDPNGYANRWLKIQLKKYGLVISKFSSKECIKLLLNAIPLGKPVLIEDVDETPDPAFDPILYRCVTPNKDPALLPLIRLDNQSAEFDENFRLYMTSSRSRSVSLSTLIPGFSSRSTIIDCGISSPALEELLMLELMAKEATEDEKQRESLEKQIATDRGLEKEAEDRILKLLSGSTLEQVLDDEAGIETMKNAKKTALDIGRKIDESRRTMEALEAKRGRYAGIVKKACAMYFTAEEMGKLEGKYGNYSLENFRTVFSKSIEGSEEKALLPAEERIKELAAKVGNAVFSSITRGVAAGHRLIFAFLFAVRTGIQAGTISQTEWNSFIRNEASAAESQESSSANPVPELMSDAGWRLALILEKTLPDKFAGLVSDLSGNRSAWETAVKNHRLPADWEPKLSPFSRVLLLLKVLRGQHSPAEVLSPFLGPELLLPHPSSAAQEPIERAFEESRKSAPIIVFFGPGAEVVPTISRLAEKRGFGDKFNVISLGQDQGIVAKRVIILAQGKGEWVVLENCHLSGTWIKELETIVEALKEPKTAIHDDFRLFLTSPQSQQSPFSAVLLNAGVKICMEKTGGVKASLRTLYTELIPHYFEGCSKRCEEFHKIMFGLCLFHCQIKDIYASNNSDLIAVILMLKSLVEDPEEIQWETLYFYVGQVIYGSRTATELGRLHITALLRKLCATTVLQPEYSIFGAKLPSSVDTLEAYQSFIDSFPADCPVETSEDFLESIRKIASRTVQLENSLSAQQTLLKLICELQAKMPPQIDLATGNKELFQAKTGVTPITGVLIREVKLYNALVEEITVSLDSAQKYLAGNSVNGPSEIIAEISRGEVPTSWLARAYPTARRLTPFLEDLGKRVEYFRGWVGKGEPKSFWISAFFFPESFVAVAVRAGYSKKSKGGIEKLWLDFKILSGNEPSAAGTIIIHGLYLQGAEWDDKKKCLTETAKSGVLLPPLIVQPTTTEKPENENMFSCSVYVTDRKGEDQKLGMTIDFPTEKRLVEHWNEKGTAIVLQLSE